MSSSPIQSNFAQFLVATYSPVKQQHPTEGRRRLALRVADQFWSLSPENRALLPTGPSSIDVFALDSDPFDDISSPEVAAPGIIVRTDYTNEEAWRTFYATLIEAEKDFTESDDANVEPTPDTSAQAGPSTSAPTHEDAEMADANAEAEEEEEDDEEEPLVFFSVLNPEDPAKRQRITGISNLTALRLLSDVSIRSAPPVPQGEKRIKPGNRLVDLDGLQEVYEGKTLWIYDAKSNSDQSVRLVNQKGDTYGTASGDSWRARGSHITELQVNLASGAMKIDFGGLDRWDYPERKRNLEEAAQPTLL
ncbi:hypothetical protein EWM64_g7661 [Hericium alpestre]|uniref:Uncharacterized protein n=1 Tax=Hericium alpestre TaxID=135208 RepID=A0A4Y9ZNI2_9AGAM|nr:hypothetical protein EWM64_g7661 [Hericium alpestre]